MALLLDRRESELDERMDDPNCDRNKLFNTYRQFKYINRLISGWRGIYEQEIRPDLSGETINTLLDIGFGGGDLPMMLNRWAFDDDYKLSVTAIDNDPRALEFIQQKPDVPEDIEFLHADAARLRQRGETYDFVISNHLLHHLSRKKIIPFCQLAEDLSKKRVIFNDLRRSILAYGLFTLFMGPFFQNSFAAEDGRRSIRRSYTREELKQVLPGGWTVNRKFPYRLVAIYTNEQG